MNIKINKEILTWAVRQSELFGIDLNKQSPKIDNWIQGKGSPSFSHVEKLSKSLHVPFGFFFLDEIPETKSPIPHFRTVDGDTNYKPSPDLMDSIQLIKKRQDWVKEYLSEMGSKNLNFVGSVTATNDPKIIASNIKKVIGIDDHWASKFKTWTEAYIKLIDLSNSAGIFVNVNGIVGNNTHRTLNVEEFRGFVLSDKTAPFIFINGRDSKSAQMFTLAHELAHIWLGQSASFDLHKLQPANNNVEKLCDKVAAEFLVSEEALRSCWIKIKRSADIYQEIARYFKVSQIVAARRLMDLEYISKVDFFKFYDEYRNREKRSSKSSGGDYYLNLPYRIGNRFMQLVYISVKQNKLLYRDAYQLTGLSGKTFETYVEKSIHNV